MKRLSVLVLSSLYAAMTIIFLPASHQSKEDNYLHTLEECLSTVDLYYDSLFESLSLLEPINEPERIFDFSSQVARNIYFTTTNIININKGSNELFNEFIIYDDTNWFWLYHL